MRTNLIKNEIDEIKKLEVKIKRTDLKYETKYMYMIFNSIIQEDLLVIIFILAKLI